MFAPEHWLLGGWYTRGLIVHQQRYQASTSQHIYTGTEYPTKAKWEQTMLQVPGSTCGAGTAYPCGTFVPISPYLDIN
jgi:hypothetical protein